MRHTFLTLLIIVIIVAFCACSSYSNVSLVEEPNYTYESELSAASQYTIGLVMKTLTNPFFVEMEKGARQAEEELDINLIVKTGAKETSIDQQIKIIEDFISDNVDGIVIAPGSSIELIPVLKKAQDSGIMIVNVDNRLNEEECANQGLSNVPFISVRNDEGAYLAVKEITKDVHEGTQALIIAGIDDAENSQLRVQGALKAFNENSNIDVVAIESANWKIDEAYSVAQVLFDKYPSVKLVFCANDMMALGVVQYLKDTGKSDIFVAGFDNLTDAQEAIKDGWMTATIDQQGSKQGYLGVSSVVDLLNGLPVDDETYISVKVITNEDI